MAAMLALPYEWYVRGWQFVGEEFQRIFPADKFRAANTSEQWKSGKQGILSAEVVHPIPRYLTISASNPVDDQVW